MILLFSGSGSRLPCEGCRVLTCGRLEVSGLGVQGRKSPRLQGLGFASCSFFYCMPSMFPVR